MPAPKPIRRSSVRPAGLLLVAALSGCAALSASDLELEVGRSETRVYGAPFALKLGQRVGDIRLGERLDQLGYTRVRGRRPSAAGEYFWGFDHFWIYQRAHLVQGQRIAPARLFGLKLARPHGEVRGFVDLSKDGEIRPARGNHAYVEAQLLFEGFGERRALRVPVSFDTLPEVAWQAVVAAEDGRFFDHGGLDGRGIARALLRNVKAGKVTQGGSTITQQLIKVRDLTPKRTLGRKVSEGLRALALEAEHSKKEILQAYLNTVYFGVVEGVSVYGLGAAARAFFGVDATSLDLAQASTLAGVIQSPNRLSPIRHAQRARERQRYVLARMVELEWVSARDAARTGLPKLAPRRLPVGPASTLRGALRKSVEESTRRLEAGRGVVVRTSIDPILQSTAEGAVRGLLRRFDAERQVSAALVVARASDGGISAYVGGDPATWGGFDRVQARRQPGSTVKPLVAAEALERCGGQGQLHMATRVRDEPLTLELPSGPWSPRNAEREYAGVADLRRVLVESLNVPTVRVARWCGWDAVAQRFRAAGLELPDEPPPSFVLGSVEASPMEILGAYVALATSGRGARPTLVERLELPEGRRIGGGGRVSVSRRPVSKASSFILRHALEDVPGGWAPAGAWGKTGTSSSGRDAWFAGGVGDYVVVVWVGSDRGAGLGLSGRGTAAPLFAQVAEVASLLEPRVAREAPRRVVAHWVDEESGLRLRRERRGSRRELFLRGTVPPRKRVLFGAPSPVIE